MDEKTLKSKLKQLQKLNRQDGVDFGEEMANIEQKLAALGRAEHAAEKDADSSAVDDWARVKLARHPQRPHSLDYIERVFEGFYELHGDRLFGDDGAMVTGLARFEGQTVVIIAQQKGRDLKENQARNYGLPHPEGYRKARRVMKMAERFGFPVITLIDSAGAFPGKSAEERNIGGALAENIYTMSTLRVPIIAVIIGEGNSGGAIGIGVGNRVLIMENAYYSVITPEGCAAILWRDRAKAPEVASALRLTAPYLLELGIVDEVIPEPDGGAHTDPDQAATALQAALRSHLGDLLQFDPEALWEQRFQRYQNLGVYEELPEEAEAATTEV